MALKCRTRGWGTRGELQWGSEFSPSWLFRDLVAAATALAVTAAAAADYPTKKTPPPAPVVGTVTPRFFVKAGFLFTINNSSSKTLFANPFQGLPGIQVIRRGRYNGNVATLGLGNRLFVTPNISIDYAAWIPMWANR